MDETKTRVTAVLDRRRSSAAGTHADKRTKRQRDRAGARRAWMKEESS